jgi:hypothetical protein
VEVEAGAGVGGHLPVLAAYLLAQRVRVDRQILGGHASYGFWVILVHGYLRS